MKLYQLKSSVTEEMLRRIGCNHRKWDGITFSPSANKSPWVYQKWTDDPVSTISYDVSDGCKIDLPPEWLEEVSNESALDQRLADEKAFATKFGTSQSESVRLMKAAWLAALEYERKRTR